MIPSSHLGGTAQSDLDAQFENALSALHDAITALIQAAPHGRDYVTQGTGAYEAARSQHRNYVEKIKDVKNCLQADYNGFLTQTGR